MKDSIKKAEIFTTIYFERIRQDIRWGGPAHDDTHNPDEWIDFIQKQCAKIGATVYDLATAELNAEETQAFRAAYRARLVKIAALAVAAIESNDRTAKND